MRREKAFAIKQFGRQSGLNFHRGGAEVAEGRGEKMVIGIFGQHGCDYIFDKREVIQ